MDITNFYLNTPLARPEYLHIPMSLIPEEIIQEYKLSVLIHNGNIMARIDKGMYSLPQAGILANQLLKDRLAPHGYTECNHTPGLWQCKTRKITFVLVVDDFRIKYTTLREANTFLPHSNNITKPSQSIGRTHFIAV
jgi:hypothetical protein